MEIHFSEGPVICNQYGRWGKVHTSILPSKVVNAVTFDTSSPSVSSVSGNFEEGPNVLSKQNVFR